MDFEGDGGVEDMGRAMGVVRGGEKVDVWGGRMDGWFTL